MLNERLYWHLTEQHLTDKELTPLLGDQRQIITRLIVASRHHMASYYLVSTGSGNGLLLTAPGHYLIQCWLITSEVLWHSLEGDFTGNTGNIYQWYVFEFYWFKITTASASGLWKMEYNPHVTYMANARHTNSAIYKSKYTSIGEFHSDVIDAN